MEKESLIPIWAGDYCGGNICPILTAISAGRIVVFRGITAQVESQRHIEYCYCDFSPPIKVAVQMQLKRQ